MVQDLRPVILTFTDIRYLVTFVLPQSNYSYFLKLMRVAILFAVLLSFFVTQVYGQKVALVLSGGGAKGLSHVGVLKALEEYKIPIDYVVGNSMGAFVGALYAAGYSPAEIEKLVTSNKFRDWATGNIEERFFYSQAYDSDASWTHIPLEPLSGGYQQFLPTNIVPPFLMDFALMELLSQASLHSNEDFNRLMIPFRCVATDIDSSILITLSSGRLNSAVRASTTFPFYVRPVRVNNRLLFDGGMIDNFPVETAISEFNPDLIIGSKAAGNYPPANEADVISQIQNMLVRRTDYTIPQDKGVMIESKVGYTGLLDFGPAEVFVDSGYSAAIRAMPEIRELTKRRIDPDSLSSARQKFRSGNPELIIDTIHVTGVNKDQARYILNKINPGNKRLHLDDIRDRYFLLLADDKISYIYPEITYDAAGCVVLLLNTRLTEKWVGSFGGNVSSTALNQAFVGVNYKHLGKFGSRIGVNGYYGRFYSSIQASARIDFPGQLPFFMSLTGNLSRKDFFRNANYFFEDPSPSFLIVDERFLDLNMGHQFGKYGKISFGLSGVGRSLNYYQDNTFSRLDTADQTEFAFVHPHVQFEINSLNRKQYASAGALFGLYFRYYEGSEQNYLTNTFQQISEVERKYGYYVIKGVYDNFFLRSGNFSFGFLVEALYSNQPLKDNFTASQLSFPSFEPLPEMAALYLSSYRSNAYLAGGMKTVYSFSRSLEARIEGYLFQPYRQLSNPGPNQQPSWGPVFPNPAYIVSGALIYNSPLGPVSLSASYLERIDEKWKLNLNIGYIIFNRSMFE